MRNVTSILLLGLLAAAGCAAAADDDNLSGDRADQAAYAACNSTQGASVPAGLSPHFQSWLAASGYADHDFARADLSGGSFGGFAGAGDCVRRDPVIFIHGNADRAMGGQIGGWEDSVQYFVSRGYRRAELYGTTYGPANALLSSQYYHSKEYVLHVRSFIEAVLEYTGAERVDIIAHSMGVTMARKAIKGGAASDLAAGGSYDVGSPLTDLVDTFVGIAGGNRGLSSCYFTPLVPTCGATNGFYPGQAIGTSVVGESAFLRDLNSTSGYEGSYRFSIWSSVDEVVGGACLVWGRNTCRVPGHTGEKVYSSFPYGHIGVRDQTAEVQYNMVVSHKAN